MNFDNPDFLLRFFNRAGIGRHLTRLGVISRVRFLVSLKVKEGDNQVHKSEVEQVIYFSKYSVVLADVNNEF